MQKVKSKRKISRFELIQISLQIENYQKLNYNFNIQLDQEIFFQKGHKVYDINQTKTLIERVNFQSN